MSKGQKLSVRELVWAKVEPYPWWPGKIVKILTQNNSRVFKISFFADPTYTYLHETQLVPYEGSHNNLNPPNTNHPQLQRALQLAEKSYARLRSMGDEGDSLEQGSEGEEEKRAKEGLEEKEEELVTQNVMIAEETKPFVEQPAPIIDLNHGQVTPVNCIQLLEVNRSHLRSSYSYQDRKQHIHYQQQLKHALLQKYNLLHIGTSKNTAAAEQRAIIQMAAVPKRSRKIQKQKQRAVEDDQISSLRIKCLRKARELLKNQQDSLEVTKYHAIQTMRRILSLSDNNHLKLKSLFVTFARSVSGCGASCSGAVKLLGFREYLERMQNQKQFDEQGSKVTQVEA